MQLHLGLDDNTITPYGRSLDHHLSFCSEHQIVPKGARRDHVTLRALASRLNPQGSKALNTDSGVGIFNATMHSWGRWWSGSLTNT